MGEGLLVEKQLDDFSCILAMVTPFVWIKVLLHLVSFPIPTHLLRVRQTTCQDEDVVDYVTREVMKDNNEEEAVDNLLR